MGSWLYSMRVGHFIFLHEKLGELYIILQKYESG